MSAAQFKEGCGLSAAYNVLETLSACTHPYMEMHMCWVSKQLNQQNKPQTSIQVWIPSQALVTEINSALVYMYNILVLVLMKIVVQDEPSRKS